MRTLIALALFALTVVGQAPDADTDPAKALRSPDPAVVDAALVKIEALALRGPEICAALVDVAAGADRTRASRALALLAGADEPGRARLLELAAGDAEGSAIAALRGLALCPDPAALDALFRLLDHPSQARATTAAKTLHVVGGPGIEPRLLARLESLIAKIDAPDVDPMRRDALVPRATDLMQLLGRRHNEALYEILCRQIRSNHRRMRGVSARLLDGFYRDRFADRARELFVQAPEATRDLVRVIIEAAPRQSDAALADRVSGDSDPEVIAWLAERRRDARDWCGFVQFDVAFEAPITAAMSLRNAARPDPMERELTLDAGDYRPAFFVGLDLALPLSQVYRWPDLWQLSREPADEGVVLRARLRPDRHLGPLTLGVGSSSLGLWVGRERLAPREIRVEFDAKDRPRRSRCFDAEGREIGSMEFLDWIATSKGRLAPSRIRWTSPRLEIDARFAWLAPGVWALREAKSSKPAATAGEAAVTLGTLEARFGFPDPPRPER